MARSFNLKADPGVGVENNIPVDFTAFELRLKQQMDEINRKYGEFHSISKRSRIGMQTGVSEAPAALPTP